MIRKNTPQDTASFVRFTAPIQIDKQMNTLEGILKGVCIDGKLNDLEVSALTSWMDEHSCVSHHQGNPFAEIVAKLRAATLDGMITDEERADLLWLFDQVRIRRNFFETSTEDMQVLHGILGGIASDGNVSIEELNGLQAWLDDHQNLKSMWPFDEIESLVLEVTRDGTVTPQEHQMVLTFLKEFIENGEHRSLEMPLNELNTPIMGLCAVCPTVEVSKKVFAFTGSSEKLTRKDLAALVHKHDGVFSERVTQEVHYLVIGAEGNPCWAFSCYGRKVEQAIKMRKKGHQILLVHEHDFWDAVADLV